MPPKGSIYSSPIRVYLAFILLAAAGVVPATQLPISLFPNSQKPLVGVNVDFKGNTQESFLQTYGRHLEDRLGAIRTPELDVERVEADYHNNSVTFKVEFQWGNSSDVALREVQTIVNGFSGRMPSHMRDSIGVWNWSRNSGFFAASIYSEVRKPDELYKLLEPVLSPKISRVEDADNPVLWNPSAKDVVVILNPEAMAALQLFPGHIQESVQKALGSYGGGTVHVGTRSIPVRLPSPVKDLPSLGAVPITAPSGQTVHLSDIATIDLQEKSKVFRTSGASSLILYSTPKPGGNVKRMSEELTAALKESLVGAPEDIEYKLLVDPSQFIGSAVKNVFHEVLLAALLAVTVLFLFVGSLKNTVTAAIEIPLSMVLAYLLMKLTGMNLNLISLGGLALSAGMNVDASVVVMENIFRHLERLRGQDLDYATKLRVIKRAVAEVRVPIIAATIASLVVFLPLAFTSELTFAVLGDLAKAVVFSHGFSIFVALILVPTIRLQLIGKIKPKPFRSPIHGILSRVERAYTWILEKYLGKAWLRWGTIAALIGFGVLLTTQVLPELKKEIIGKPDSDWVMVGMNTDGNTHLNQMEEMLAEMEARLMHKFSDDVLYTFAKVGNPNSCWIMARLRDKHRMEIVRKKFEEEFVNTPFKRYWHNVWNPSKLPLPDPPDFRLTIRGSHAIARTEVAREIRDRIAKDNVIGSRSINPGTGRKTALVLRPSLEQWVMLKRAGTPFDINDLADLTLVATEGRQAGQFQFKDQIVDIQVRYPQDRIKIPEDVESLPVRVGKKLVPIKALARIEEEFVPPNVFRLNEKELVEFDMRYKLTEKKSPETRPKLEKIVETVLMEAKTRNKGGEPIPTVHFEDAQKDLNVALKQLAGAMALSILLIFVTLVFQFGSVGYAMLVMVAIPFGLIGALSSLYIFGSTLSLNSALGAILLNGIAVANSILLVDFMRREVQAGSPANLAALRAARARLRPVLMTSLTTVLGMLPIALGLGEGGKILQPLGIAVSGGLWVSTLLTLVMVPTIQAMALSSIVRRKPTPLRPRPERPLVQPPPFRAGLTRESPPRPRQEEYYQ